MPRKSTLPIFEIIPEIKKSLKKNPLLVLQAPPGAGKTTGVPLELLKEEWASKGKILMLEPRRIAARNAARWMAGTLEEKVGGQVGYSVHLDRKVSGKTRIEVMTEGVFLRRLLNNPELHGVSMVIFDEFHERSLEADLSLALLKETQEILREDLKILVMSATLDAGPVASFLNNAPLISSEGKSYPVEVSYCGAPDNHKLIPHVVSTIIEALRSEAGSILVFLPGVGEINRVLYSLENQLDNKKILIQALHGSLSSSEQEKAIEPAAGGTRKVVLATSIAESSITIKGIRVVIDSGLVRKPKFNPRTAMDSLETLDISIASADQRTGRAGRNEAGVCYRLWERHKKMDAFSEPSIVTEDLAALSLSLAKWGYSDIDNLQWLTKPDLHIFKSCRKLLQSLAAIDGNRITTRGEAISNLPLHPRLASMILEGGKLGVRSLACDMAAILSERDILTFPQDFHQSDLQYRMEALKGQQVYGGKCHIGRLKRIRDYSRSMEDNKEDYTMDLAGLLLISAYPDRIAQNRGDGLFQLANGSNAILFESDSLSHQSYLIVPNLGGTGAVPRIFMAFPLQLGEILQARKESLQWINTLEFNREKKKFSAKKLLKLDHLILKEERLSKLPEGEFQKALCNYLSFRGLSDLNWSKEALKLRDRVNFLHTHEFKGFPDFSEKTLASNLEWLIPFMSGISLKSSLDEIHLIEALKGQLDWSHLKELDSLAPTHFTVPSGSNIPIDYSKGNPILKVRIQELFGLRETPSICRGDHSLVIHLLSPASRPIQITRDLKSFWENTYREVKKDLMGRYPKHYWPENPLEAEPTNRAKRRK